MILTMSILCFLANFYFLIAKLTGPLLFTTIFRLVGILGTILPVIYWLKLMGWI
jgi:hypothetical protein